MEGLPPLHLLADRIAALSRSRHHHHQAHVIYVAIGCAQGHHPPERRAPQQYPPFLAAWPHQTILLIDPALEDPPQILHDVEAAGTPEEICQGLQFFAVRAPFYWTNPDHRAYIGGILRLILAAPRPTHLIVQDFTGYDIQPEFTRFLTEDFPPADTRRILHRVLFDPAYDGPGCFQDTTIPILRHPATGDFLQPAYMPLQRLIHARPPPSPAILRHQIERRSAAIRYYAYRLWRELRGELPPSDHVTPAVVTERLQFFQHIYGYAPIAHPTILRNLIEDTLRDFAATAGEPRPTDEAITILLTDPRGNALNLEFHRLTCRILGVTE
jgi:hypothetical protein